MRVKAHTEDGKFLSSTQTLTDASAFVGLQTRAHQTNGVLTHSPTQRLMQQTKPGESTPRKMLVGGKQMLSRHTCCGTNE